MFKSNSRLVDILIVVLISSFVGIVGGACYMYSLQIKNKDEHIQASNIAQIDEVYNTIVNKYYDDVDQEKLVEAAVSGMLSTLDKNTSYLDSNSTDNFNKKMKGEYYGVGIEALNVEDGVLVVSVMKGSPAEDSGILENDIIIEVDGESLKGKPTTYFTDIVSKSDKELKLVVNRKGRELNINVTPEKVIIESVTSNNFKVDGKSVGYIKISVFAANTASQFSSKLKLLEDLGIDALVIDVRNNSGGYLSNAATILEMFMKKGEILYKTESKTSVVTREDETDEYRDYPVAILVNASSASASEVLTACFMENRDSKVIGTITYGKGTVQETLNVLDNSMAKITTKKWLTPKGNWINESGITPTIVLDISDKYLQNPTFDNDNQLERAINEVIKK